VAYGELLVSLEKGSLQTAPSATQLGMFPYIMEKRRDVIALEVLFRVSVALSAIRRWLISPRR
jgi:hypothetical protein